MTFKIITWNINSVRLRLPLLLDLIKTENPDIIALQETKTPDEHFPAAPIMETGLEHMHFNGMKGYNGVALLSRHPLTSTAIHHRCGQDDCRHIAVRLTYKNREIIIHNLYIPAGGYEPDPVTNDKFQHKLDFVEDLTAFFTKHHTSQDSVIALGDFNIAPMEHDVWSHKQLLKVVSHTPAETSRLAAMQDTLNWIDTTRHFIPATEKAFTWWSYRNKDWKKSNRGRRLDHIWVTPPLGNTLHAHKIMRPARDWPKPSDHVPVVLELDL